MVFLHAEFENYNVIGWFPSQQNRCSNAFQPDGMGAYAVGLFLPKGHTRRGQRAEGRKDSGRRRRRRTERQHVVLSDSPRHWPGAGPSLLVDLQGQRGRVRRPPADRDEDEDDRLVVRHKRQIQHQDYGDGRTTAAAASDEDEETRDRRFEPGEGHPGLRPHGRGQGDGPLRVAAEVDDWDDGTLQLRDRGRRDDVQRPVHGSAAARAHGRRRRLRGVGGGTRCSNRPRKTEPEEKVKQLQVQYRD